MVFMNSNYFSFDQIPKKYKFDINTKALVIGNYGKSMCTVGSDCCLRVWDFEHGQEKGTLKLDQLASCLDYKDNLLMVCD